MYYNNIENKDSKRYLKIAEIKIDNLRNTLKCNNKQITNDNFTLNKIKFDNNKNSLKKIDYNEIMKDINHSNTKDTCSELKSNSINKLQSLYKDFSKMLKINSTHQTEKEKIDNELNNKANIETILNIQNRINNVSNNKDYSKSPRVIRSTNKLFPENISKSNFSSDKTPFQQNSRNCHSLLKVFSNNIYPLKNNTFLNNRRYIFDKNSIETINPHNSKLFKFFK